MSQWDKLIADILNRSPNLRFEDLRKKCRQPKGGSSHYTFRKPGCAPVTLPKHEPLKRVYIELIAEIVRAYLEEE